MTELAHATAIDDAPAAPAGVTLRSDSSAVRFLQQNQAVAATLDASTVAIRPEQAGCDAVLAHEYAHIAQLRSGLIASRADAERRADAVAHGSVEHAGGAAPPPMFQTVLPGAAPDLETGRAMSEERDIGLLGGGAGLHPTINVVTTQAESEQFGELTFHVNVRANGANGSINSVTDVSLHSDRRPSTAPVVVGPGRGPGTLVTGREDVPVVVAPAPTVDVELYPIVLRYHRTIELTDADGRNVAVRIASTVYFTAATWARVTAGLPPTLETLTAVQGDEGVSSVSIAGTGPLQPYYTWYDSPGRSVDVQSALTQIEFAIGRGLLGPSSAPATFIEPRRTAGEQFESLEAFLRSADALELERRVRAAAQNQAELGWFGSLLDTTGNALASALNAVGEFFSDIGQAISDFWSSLSPATRGILEGIGAAVAAVAAVIGIAALVVAFAPVELTVGAVALVIGGIMLAYSFATSLYSRGREAASIGLYDPAVVVGVALMDAFGLNAVIEAITDRSILSGRELHRSEEERYRAGTTGVIGILMTVLGGRSLLRGRTPIGDLPPEGTTPEFAPEQTPAVDVEVPADDVDVLPEGPQAWTATRPDGVPANWTQAPNKANAGSRWIDPQNPGNTVRSSPGNPNSPYATSRRPYMRQTVNGRYIDKNGNFVEYRSEDGHIPADQYRFIPPVDVLRINK